MRNFPAAFLRNGHAPGSTHRTLLPPVGDIHPCDQQPLPADEADRGSIAQEAIWIDDARRDARAFAPLYERHHRPVYLFVLKRVGDRDRAGDLTSQVFLKAMLALPRYVDRGAPFRAWLYRIALNEVLMFHRRMRGRVYMDVEAADARRLLGEVEVLPAEADHHEQRIGALTAALGRLAPAQAMLVELHWFDGLAYAEVGHVLGIGEDAAKMRTHRAIKQLRLTMQKAR